MVQFWCRLASDCCFLQYGCWYHQNVEAWNNTVSVSQLVESEHKTHVCGFNSGSKIRCGAIAVNSVGLSPPKTDVGYTVVEGKGILSTILHIFLSSLFENNQKQLQVICLAKHCTVCLFLRIYSTKGCPLKPTIRIPL